VEVSVVKLLDQYCVEDRCGYSEFQGYKPTVIVWATSEDDAIKQVREKWDIVDDDYYYEGALVVTRITQEQLMREAGEPELFDTSQFTSGSIGFLHVPASQLLRG
jgi:hypothetical protein